MADKDVLLSEALFLIKLNVALQVGENLMILHSDFDPEKVQAAAESRAAIILRMYEFIVRCEERNYTLQELADWAYEEVSRLMLEVKDDNPDATVELDDVWKDALDD